MNPTLLLVDDEQAVTDAIESSLTDEHYTIYKAGCAAEALSILENHPITVIISDQVMPGMSGLELCSQVHERWPTTYRILLIDTEQDKNILSDPDSKHEGDVHQLLEKPWDAMLLRYNINEGIRQQRILQQALILKGSFQQSDQACFITDSNWVIQLASPSAASWLGLHHDDLVGKNLFASNISNNSVKDEAQLIHTIESQAHWQGCFHFNTRSIHGDESWMCIVPFLEDHYLCLAIPMIDDMLHKLSSNTQETLAIQENFKSDLPSPKKFRYLKLSFEHPKVRELDFITVINEQLQLATDNLYRIITTANGEQIMQLPHTLDDDHIENLLANIHQTFIAPFIFHGQSSVLKWKSKLVSSDDLTRSNQSIPNENEAVTQPPSATTSSVHYQGHSYYQPQKYSTTGFSCLPIFDQDGKAIALMPPSCPHREDIEDWLIDALECTREWQSYSNTDINWINDFSDLKPHHALRAIAAIISLQSQTGQENNSWWLILSTQQVNDITHSDEHILQQLDKMQTKVLVKDPDYHLNNIKDIRSHLSDTFAGIYMSHDWLFDSHQQLKRHSIQLLHHLKKQPLLFFAADIRTAEQLALLHQSPCHWLAGDILSAKLLPQQISWLHQ
jgi:CheY-like chemotaxis protein